MDPSLQSSQELMSRFKWIDSNTVRIVNFEGIEKIVDMKNNFRELEYNVIPLFNNSEIKDKQRHFFYNRTPLEVQQVLERL